MFLAIPSLLEISLIGTPSLLCNRRISAHCSTTITLPGSGGVKIHPSPGGQYSPAVDTWIANPGLSLQFDWGEGPRGRGPDGVLRATLLFCAWVAWPRCRVVLPLWDQHRRARRIGCRFERSPRYAVADDGARFCNTPLVRATAGRGLVVKWARNWPREDPGESWHRSPIRPSPCQSRLCSDRKLLVFQQKR